MSGDSEQAGQVLIKTGPVTSDDVEDAIVTLILDGINPSIDAIRVHLGRLAGFEDGTQKGSPNTVLKFKQAWTAKVKEQRAIPLPSHIPESARAVIYGLWDAVKAEATKTFDFEREKHEKAVQVAMAASEQFSAKAEKNFEEVARLWCLLEERDAEILSLSGQLKSEKERCLNMDRLLSEATIKSDGFNERLILQTERIEDLKLLHAEKVQELQKS